jgi:hypothetical protein
MLGHFTLKGFLMERQGFLRFIGAASAQLGALGARTAESHDLNPARITVRKLKLLDDRKVIFLDHDRGRPSSPESPDSGVRIGAGSAQINR